MSLIATMHRDERSQQETCRSALEVDALVCRFGAVSALADVTFSVAAGERRAVLGSNGAGKTTLFNCVTGDVSPTSGRVRLFGEDITRVSVQGRIRRGLRRTYQISLPFRGLTVRESLFLAVRGVSPGRFSLVRPRPDGVDMVCAEGLAAAVHLDDNLDRVVGELSHGQLRQLEIGMALAGAPRLILLDEPAAGLSPAERRGLVAMLHALPKHIGFIIIEHDLDVALRVAERVTVMHLGRVFRHGSTDEIEADPDVQRLYLGSDHA